MITKKSPNPTDKHVGARVRMRRMMMSMSQEKLGDAIGLTFQQVQKYEKGSNRIGSSRLAQIAHVLQVPVSFFFDGAPTPTGIGFAGPDATPDVTQDFLTDRQGVAIAKAWPKVPLHLRAALVAFVEAAANPGKVINKKAA